MSTSNHWLALRCFSVTEAFVCFCTSLCILKTTLTSKSSTDCVSQYTRVNLVVPETKKWPKLISRLEKENINVNHKMVNRDNFSFSIDNRGKGILLKKRQSLWWLFLCSSEFLVSSISTNFHHNFIKNNIWPPYYKLQTIYKFIKCIEVFFSSTFKSSSCTITTHHHGPTLPLSHHECCKFSKFSN